MGLFDSTGNSGAASSTASGSPGLQAILALLNFANGEGTNSEASSAMKDGLKQALTTIQNASNQAIGTQQAFLQGGTQDYNRLRGLVNQNYYQTPYGRSFTGQTPANSGFSFNPTANGGQASFQAFQPQGGPAQFIPPSMPGMPNIAPYQPPQGQGPQTQGPPQWPNPMQQGQQTAMQNQPLNPIQPGNQNPNNTAINMLPGSAVLGSYGRNPLQQLQWWTQQGRGPGMGGGWPGGSGPYGLMGGGGGGMY